jgi:guanylate kinase
LLVFNRVNFMSNIFIITGPAGAGEDSIIKELGRYIDFEKIITTTSRPMRSEDKEGVSYYFISKEDFEKGIKENGFFEYALEDNGNYYGGTYDELERVKKITKPVIWKIDYKGVINAKRILPKVKSIYIYIPLELIEKRLKNRGDSLEIIQSRLNYAKGWYDNEHIFDFKVENEEGKLNEAVKKVARIIKENISS